MPGTQDDLTFATTRQGMSDEAVRFPDETRYRLPAKW